MNKSPRTALCSRSLFGPTPRCSFPIADIDRLGSIVMAKPRPIRKKSGLNQHLERHQSVTAPYRIKLSTAALEDESYVKLESKQLELPDSQTHYRDGRWLGGPELPSQVHRRRHPIANPNPKAPETGPLRVQYTFVEADKGLRHKLPRKTGSGLANAL